MMAVSIILPLMFFLVFMGVPIAVSIGAAALVGVYTLHGVPGFYNAALALFDGATSFPLIAIPLFILAGALMNTSSISRRLIEFVSALIGFMRGGLAMVNIGVSLFFAEISGSAVADVAATGSVLIPGMKRKGYKGTFAAAITSSSASLAIIIPPSIPMILYGALSDTSIVQLFVAGVVPGLLGAFGLMCVSYYFAVKHDIPRDERFDLKRVRQTFRDAAWALTLPFIILGGIFGGLVTATEGAGLAVVAAVVIGGFIYRELDFPMFFNALREGINQTATVMLLVATSAVLGLYLTEEGLPQMLATAITGFTDDPFVVLMLLNVLLLVLGCILHGAAAIILVVPIVLPLIQQVGIDPVHFGIILTLNLAIGQQTPPVASVLVTSCSIAKTDIWETTKVNAPFIGVLVAVLLAVTYLPFIPMTLVEIFYR
ncbi:MULTISPECIES: TRAP transporter large permease [Pseudomonadota]|uniref:TRAP transporter large permease n=1 Tax=Pseudomonadota TaxID=1224 RepID=UPI003A8F0B6F